MRTMGEMSGFRTGTGKDIDCRARRSGSTPAGPAPRRYSTSATRSLGARRISTGSTRSVRGYPGQILGTDVRGGLLQPQRLRAVRHARERLGVVLGLVRRGLLQSVIRGRPAGGRIRPFRTSGCAAAGGSASPAAPVGDPLGTRGGLRESRLGFRLALRQPAR